jgi:molybdopterin/thiamine biosynthesis adenylyltransferase
MKVILGIGEPLSGRLLVFDALAMEMRVVQVHSDPGCPACGPLSRDGKVEACPSV